MDLLFFAFLALIAVSVLATFASLMLNGAWRAVRRRLRWPKKIRLEPDAFIANLRLYRPETMAIRAMEKPVGGDAAMTAAYRMSFDASVNRTPVRFMTVFDAGVIPGSGVRIYMLMALGDGRPCPSWNALTDTVKAIVRLLDNARIGKYHGPATTLSDSYQRFVVEHPTAVIAAGPADPAPEGKPMTLQTVSQRLSGHRSPKKRSA